MGPDWSDDFGSRLRAARERKGISLRDIAQRTKISMGVLEALERDDISRLPGGIFSRAFVRSYAHEVGLEPEKTIQEFLAQFPQESVNAAQPRFDAVEDTELFESDRRAASSALWILAASVALAAAVLYLSVDRGSSAPGDGPEAASAVSDAVSRGVLPAAEPPAATTGAGSPAVVSTAAQPAISTEAEAAATDTGAAPSAQAATSGLPPTAKEGHLAIRLAARRPVWVSATVDGRKALSRLLQTGEEEAVDVAREMVITAGDAAAIRMTLNGAEARPLGKTGEVVTVRLTVTNFTDYLLQR